MEAFKPQDEPPDPFANVGSAGGDGQSGDYPIVVDIPAPMTITGADAHPMAAVRPMADSLMAGNLSLRRGGFTSPTFPSIFFTPDAHGSRVRSVCV